MAKNLDSQEKPVIQQHLDGIDPDSEAAARSSSSGTLVPRLVPRPSDDPNDPLACLPVIYLAHHPNAMQELGKPKKTTKKKKKKEQNHHGYLVS